MLCFKAFGSQMSIVWILGVGLQPLLRTSSPKRLSPFLQRRPLRVLRHLGGMETENAIALHEGRFNGTRCLLLFTLRESRRGHLFRSSLWSAARGQLSLGRAD